jgi:hypothetical protein
VSVLEFSVHAGNYRWKQDLWVKFIKHSWQDLEARYKSSNEVNMTPRSTRTKPEKMEIQRTQTENVESCETRRFIYTAEKLTSRAHMQLGQYSRRLGKQHKAKEAAGWAEVGPGRPAQPTSRPSRPPFDLTAIWAIYSPEARHHASILSSSAAEEQRREGHHLGGERVELVV